MIEPSARPTSSYGLTPDRLDWFWLLLDGHTNEKKRFIIAGAAACGVLYRWAADRMIADLGLSDV